MSDAAPANRWDEFEVSWRTLLRSMPDYAAVLDAEGGIGMFNRPLPGIAGDQMSGSTLYEWIAAEDRVVARSAMAEALQTGRTVSCQVALPQAGESPVRFLFRMAPIGADGPSSRLLLLGSEVQDPSGNGGDLRASEANYRAIFNNAADGIFVHEPETGRILDVNAKVCEMFGYTPEEAVGLDVGELSSAEPPFTQDDALRWLRKAATEGPLVFDWLARHKKGRLFWAEVSLKRAAIGGMDRILAIVRDIDVRKRTEVRLRFLTSAVEQTSDGVAVADLDGRLLFVNRAFATLHGYEPQELMGKHLSTFHTSEQMPAVDAANRQIMETGQFVGEIWHVHRDGTAFPTVMHNSRLHDELGEPAGMIGTCRDITATKEAEEALRESERRLATLMGNLPGMAYRCRNDADWTMEFVSDGCIGLTGYEPADLVDNAKVSWAGLIHRRDRQLVWDLVQEALETRDPFQLIYRIHKRNGDVRWVWEQGMGVFSEEEELLALEGFITDITDRQNAEVNLKESEERFRRLAGATSQGIITHADGRVLDVNERAAELFGYETAEMIGMNIFDFAAPESSEIARAKVLSGDEEPYEGIGRRKDGSCFPAEVVGRSIPYRGGTARVTAIHDITEYKRAEQEIRARAEAERFLLRELDHRVRNNLASLSALIRLAASVSTDVDHFAASIDARVQAMATVHGLLSRTHWQPVQLQTLFEAQVLPGCAGKLEINGPPVPVAASQAQALGMVINELMTNSLKYGALGVREGLVEVTWEADRAADGGSRISLTWQESGGPEISAGLKEGAGTALIAGLMKSELRGSVEFGYPPAGAQHAFELHLDSRPVPNVRGVSGDPTNREGG